MLERVRSKSTVGCTCRSILSQLVNGVSHSITPRNSGLWFGPGALLSFIDVRATMILMVEDHCLPIAISDVRALVNSL